MSQSLVRCSICEREFNTTRGLKIHITKTHKGVQQALSSDGQSQHISSATCDMSDTKSLDKCTVDAHMHKVHINMPTVDDANASGINVGASTSTVLASSSSSSSTSSSVQTSVAVTGRVKCTVCDKVCKNVAGLRFHNMNVHKQPVASSSNVDTGDGNLHLPSSSVHQEETSMTTRSQTVSSENTGPQHVDLLPGDARMDYPPTSPRMKTPTVTDANSSGINVDASTSTVLGSSSSTSSSAQTYVPVTGRCETLVKVKCTLCDKVCKNVGGLHLHNMRVHKQPVAGTSNVDTGDDNLHLPSSSVQQEETSMTTRSQTVSSVNTGPQHAEHSPGDARTHYTPTSPKMKTNLKKKMRDQLAEFHRQFLCVKRHESTTMNQSHRKLKDYHDRLLLQVQNTATEKLTREVEDVIDDCTLLDTKQQAVSTKWTTEDGERLKRLNESCKGLPVPDEWHWAAKDDTEQGQYNRKRLEFCVEKEMETKVIHCPQCKSTGVLVGLDQIESSVCYDCLLSYQLGATKKAERVEEAWKSVRPASSSYPKRVEPGHENEDLPQLTPGEKALIAAVHPVVTVTRNSIANKKYRQENISLLRKPEETWTKVLPRTDLNKRFMVVERRFKNSQNKYIIANPEKVRQWLGYLFRNHREYTRMNKMHLLELSSEAMESLQDQAELAEVVFADDKVEHDCGTEPEDGITQAAMESGLTKAEVFTFDRFPALYLNARQILKIRQKGKIEIVEDNNERRPSYNTSANLCFPDLYANGELSALDFGDHKLSTLLLKKQALFAHTMSDGRYRWKFGEDSVHMMHQYAHLVEQRVHALVGYYISQHPDSAAMPIESVLQAFKDGPTEDGLLESKLPDMTRYMNQIPNTRERWFAERLGIEAMSRDLGEPNVFITLNMDARAWPDVRRLLYRLEYGEEAEMDRNWFEMDTGKFTELLDRYAVQVSIYLSRKVKIFTRAFLCDICGIPSTEDNTDWIVSDRTSTSFFWSRAEFTETRGISHWHIIAKLPNVLDTALLGRMIQNGRVVRQELKRGNIKADRVEEAWTILEMGLLASRYAILFAESISTASFFEDNLNADTYVPEKVIDVEKFRQEFVSSYVTKDVSVSTHPIMRTFSDAECDANENVEAAKVASVSCMHHCIQRVCGGEEKTGAGCRFQFPKKNLRYTVPAMIQVNPEQMEAHMLLRRTCDRVPNLNRYFLRYWRANHDVTVLIDAAHKMRYATKYVAKSAKHSELIDEVIENLSKRSQDLLPPNIKQTLSHLILADCSHRSFLSKQELAYKVMDLPEVRKSFNDVKVVGFYRRANIIENSMDNEEIVYSDRTEYSAYAERCRDSTECIGFEKSELDAMNFREFAETVSHTWRLDRKLEAQQIGPSLKRKFKTRDIDSGHWELRKLRKRSHVRWSTVVYSEPASEYIAVEPDDATSQTLYFDLPLNKRKQLYRAYQELVCYMPWKNSPEETFLHPDTCMHLEDGTNDPEFENRYSLRRLDEFHKTYMELSKAGRVAPPGSQWQRDNQYSYTMYLTTVHNREIHLDRVENKGIFKARYEPAEEYSETDRTVELQLAIVAEGDQDEFPSVDTFMPPDAFSEILKQPPPKLLEVSVAFPLQHMWQKRQDMLAASKSSLFMADPPSPAVPRENLSFWHQKAIDLLVRGEQQILYIYGKAGTGKTEVALHICDIMKGHVQAGAGTGKAASNFNGPTIHAMFGWSHNEFSDGTLRTTSQQKLSEMRVFYEQVNLFIIDEVNAMSAAQLAMLNETMCNIFDPDQTQKAADGTVKPFGGKTMLFMGDAAQLRPVCGEAIYDRFVDKSVSKSGRRTYYSSLQMSRNLKGQELYAKYLSPHCIWLRQGFRNKGLLQEIFDRVRNGTQTEDDLDKVMYQRRKFPDARVDYGIHYSNESCSVSNVLDLWQDCKQQQPPQRMYVCRAGYHVTGDNDLVVSSLSSMKPADYSFAADVICLAVGCEVRLIKNLNLSAGLVNSTIGIVVRVVYNNADVSSLLDGKHPAPYCIIVRFPMFRGFLRSQNSNERVFPLADRQCVPLYRERFVPKCIPSWIRKKQKLSLCYREQFPIDLSRNITAHRAQGQTWKHKLLSVDLGLESPSNRVPPDVGSLIYVACTRVNELKNLFVSPIFPSVWSEIGKSEVDRLRRQSEVRLTKCAEEFAITLGCYDELKKELSVAEAGMCVDSTKEWTGMLSTKTVPTPAVPQPLVFNSHEELLGTSEAFGPAWLRPAATERHIGIDQGIKNFAIVAVDKSFSTLPRVVGAEVYNLEAEGLSHDRKFDVNDLVLLLQQKTVLMSWIQQDGYQQLLPHVDRVIVHIEQISKRNKYNKQFEIELGRLLQRVTDVTSCVVKLSQPHVHRRNGPMFKLGDGIKQACKLEPASSSVTARQVSADPQPSSSTTGPQKTVERQQQQAVYSDVEPDSEPESLQVSGNISAASEYGRKKQMSSDIFQYFMNSDSAQQLEMQVEVSAQLQELWKQKQASSEVQKFDDLGDALLHALNEILCGTSNYRALVPATPSLHVNRSVIVTVLPTKVYWAVIQCTWNLFTLENFGVCSSHLDNNQMFKSKLTAAFIKDSMQEPLKQALISWTGSNLYSQVEQIRVIVKQLKEEPNLAMSRIAAGALTNATVEAMKAVCDEVGGSGHLSVRNSKTEGWAYIRTLSTGEKIQVTRSTGKHTNAMVSCLEWMKVHAASFVQNRQLYMSRQQKLAFFFALESRALSHQDGCQMEMVRLSSQAASLFREEDFSDSETRTRLADLMLIGLNKNGHYVSAVAGSYRQ